MSKVYHNATVLFKSYVVELMKSFVTLTKNNPSCKNTHTISSDIVLLYSFQ